MNGLIIRSPYVDWILAGTKTWSIRWSPLTKLRQTRARDGFRSLDCLPLQRL